MVLQIVPTGRTCDSSSVRIKPRTRCGARAYCPHHLGGLLGAATPAPLAYAG